MRKTEEWRLAGLGHWHLGREGSRMPRWWCALAGHYGAQKCPRVGFLKRGKKGINNCSDRFDGGLLFDCFKKKCKTWVFNNETGLLDRNESEEQPATLNVSGGF